MPPSLGAVSFLSSSSPCAKLQRSPNRHSPFIHLWGDTGHPVSAPPALAGRSRRSLLPLAPMKPYLLQILVLALCSLPLKPRLTP